MNATQARVSKRYRRMREEIKLEKRIGDPAFQRRLRALSTNANQAENKAIQRKLLQFKPRCVPPTREGVYAFRCGEFIKIGKAWNIAQRYLSIRAVNPYLEFVCVLSEYQRDEEKFHRMFAEHRVEGEWFRAEGLESLPIG